MTNSTEKPTQPLDDLVVLDLGQVYNGPYCGLLFAQLGATVIKIEPPGGEMLRYRSGPATDSYEFVMLNGGKKSLMLDLKAPEGRETFLHLAATADVLIENFSAGVMERLGLGYETLHQLNPRLVYAKGTGYGETGPFANLPAMDLTIQAVSGAMSTTGFPDQPPVKSGPAFADFLGGVHLFAGILAALHERSRSGEGRSVEVAMYDTMIPTLTSPLAALMSDRLVSDRVGNRHSGLAIAPYNVYEASDGYLAILCVSAKHWLRLTVCMARQDLAEDPRFVRQHLRAQNMDELDAIVEEWTKTRTRDELLTLLRQSGVPAAPVQTVREVAQDPHLHERGALQWLRHDQLGQVLVPGCPIRIGENTPITGISPHLDGEGEQFRRQVRDAVLQVDAEEHLMAAPSNRPSQEST